MAYPHDAFPFPMEHQPQSNMYFQHPIQYTPYLQQPQHHPEMMYTHPPFSDYVDYMSMGMMPEDYDENAEVSTRPRLTKEQVEVLESQFQAHPKPNSMVKKQLAIQTKLTLPRVANWFQNRRAKAKQQRKQEEFEISQSIGASSSWKDDDRTGAAELSSKASSPARRPSTRDERSESLDPTSPAKSPVKSESLRDGSWVALQRSFGLSNPAQQQRSYEQTSHVLIMPPPERPLFSGISINAQRLLHRAQTSSLSPTSDWSNNQNVHELTSPETATSNSLIQDMGFDFGFNQDVSTTSVSSTAEDSPTEGNQQYVVANDDWTAAFTAQTSAINHQSELMPADELSPLALPAYPESRRGSGSDELTANLGTFALAGTPPISVNQMVAPVRPTDGEIDIASRRKRPRPAALCTSASLRSRSYGQLTSTSPAFRPGPPSGNALRHVKSTGHSLNSHYAGIRKSSLPQKSPLTMGFAETESLKRLMAQQAAALSNKTPLTTPSLTEVGPSPMSQELAAQLGLAEDKTNMVLPSEILAKYQNLQSPPHTPFQTDYMMQAASLSMPPPSARSQYAQFVEYTPPYSAGPLTNSTCWSDGPLQSPDFTGFPPGSFVSPLSFPQQQEVPVPQWMHPTDGMAELGLQHLGLPEEHKKTEFFITEFPGQREEYASIAQHVPQPKPKNYVFANTAPSDYDG